MRALNALHLLLACVLWVIGVTGLLVMVWWPLWLVWLSLAAFLGVWVWRRKPLIMGTSALGVFLLMLIIYLLQPARNDREWWTETSRLPRIEIEGDRVTIHELRNFTWRTRKDFDALWETRSYDLGKLDTVELIIEPLRGSELMAHTMLGFGFSDGRHLIVSAEARKERDETFGVLPGAFRQFELIYLFGDEEDLLTVRAVGEGALLYAYPIKASPEFMRHLFLDLCHSAIALHQRPCFYASLRQNCTTTLVKHFDKLLPSKQRIGLRAETVFPYRTGEYLHRIGRMDTELSYEEAREQFRIDEKVRQFAGQEDFSVKIRQP